MVNPSDDQGQLVRRGPGCLEIGQADPDEAHAPAWRVEGPDQQPTDLVQGLAGGHGLGQGPASR